MLEFLNFVVLLFKVLVFCLIVAFFFWVAPAMIMEIVEEQQGKQKRHHRRRRGDDDQYMVYLVEAYRERKNARKYSHVMVARAEPVWSM